MSYKLADGSMSTDYKIGDKFTHKYEHGIYIFIEDDGTKNPWFKSEELSREASNWKFLTPVKTKQHASVINQLRSTIQYLERTLEELER
jgi:hypothetical protein